MITPKMKKVLKKHLKNDYTDAVLEILAQRNITNRNGNLYSASAIKNCLNGISEHSDIEKAITIVYNNRKKAALKHQEQLKKAIS